MAKLMKLVGPAFLLAACGPMTPQSYTASAPRPAGDVFTCALRNLGELGYTVMESEREGGLIRAERPSDPGLAALNGTKMFSEVTVVVYPAEGTGGSDLRVTAARSSQNPGKDRTPGAPIDKRTQMEADALRNACGS